MSYKVIMMPEAIKMLKGMSDRRIRDRIRERIDGLSEDPEKQGKALIGELAGYRAIRVAGERYRIIYRVDLKVITIFIIALGIRKEGSKTDIYNLAKKLMRLRLLDPDR